MASEDDDLKYLSYTLPEDISRKLARGGIDVENEFGGGRELTDEDRNIGWGDLGRGFSSGSYKNAADIAADVEYLSAGNLGSNARRALNQLSEEELQQASRQFRRAAEAAFIPSEGKESIFDVGVMDAILAKGAQTLPSLIASFVPAFAVTRVMRGASLGARAIAGAVTAKGTASALNMGDLANQLYSEVDKLTDEQLAKQSSAFNGYLLMGMAPEEARRRFSKDLAGIAPLAAAAVTYATGGLEGMVGARLGGDTAKGFLRGFGKGFLAEGGQEVAESAGNEVMAQEALSRYNLGEKDWVKVLNSAVEGFALGGIMGGPIGGLSNIDIKGKPRVAQTTGDAAQDAALASTPITPPAPEPTSPTTSEPIQLSGVEDAKQIVKGIDERLATEPRPIDPAQEAALRGFTDEEDREASGFWFNQETPNTVVQSRGGDTGMNTPESRADLEAQWEQLVDGDRRAILYPRGTEELPLPRGMQFVETDAGVWHFNPALIDKPTIEALSARGRENEILGYGPFNKEDIIKRATQTGEPLVSVSEKTPDGATTRAAVGTTGTAPIQQQAIQQNASPGNVVETEPLDQMLGRRNVAPQEPIIPPAPSVPPKAAKAKAVSKAKQAPAAPTVDLLSVEQAKIEGVPDELQAAAARFLSAGTVGEQFKAESAFRLALPLDEANALIAQLKARKTPAKAKKVNRKAAAQALQDAKDAMARGDEAAAAEARQRISASLPMKEAKATIDGLTAPTQDQPVKEEQTLEDIVRKLGDDYTAARAAGNLDEMAEIEEQLYDALTEEQFNLIMPRLKRAAEAGTKPTAKQAARSRAAQKATGQLEAPKKELTDEERAAELKAQAAEQQKDRRRGFDTSAKAVSTSDSNTEEILASRTEVKIGDAKADAELTQRGKEKAPVRKPELSDEEKQRLAASTPTTKREAVIRRVKDKSQAETKRADKEQGKADRRLANKIKKISSEYEARGLQIGSKVIEQQAKAAIAQEDRKASQKKGVGSGQLDITRELGKKKSLPIKIDEGVERLAVADEVEPARALVADRQIEVELDDGSVIAVKPLQTLTTGAMLESIKTNFDGVAGVLYNFLQQRLVKLIGNMKLHIVEYQDNFSGPGWYETDGDYIVITTDALTDPKRLAHIVLHEAIHGATAKALEANWLLRTDIEEIMLDVLERYRGRPASEFGFKSDKTFGELYAFTDAYEFLAEALSNRTFMELLQKTPVSPELAKQLRVNEFTVKNLWQALVEKIRQVLSLPNGALSVLEATLSAYERAEAFNEAIRGQDNRESIRRVLPIKFDEVTPNNLTQRVSGNMMASASRAAMEAGRQATNLGDWARKKLVRIMTNDHLRQAAEQVGGDFGNAFFKVTDAIEKMGKLGRDYMQRGTDIATMLYNLKRKDPTRFEKFEQLAMAATTSDIHPNKPLSDPIHRYMYGWDGKLRKRYEQSAARHADLHADYKALVKEDPSYAEAYAQTQGYFAEMQDAVTFANLMGALRHADSTINLPEGTTLEALGKWVYEGGLDIPVEGEGTLNENPDTVSQAQAYRAALGKKLVDQLTNISSLKKIQGAYFPMMRRGDFVIQGFEKVDPMGGVYNQEEGTVLFKTLADAKRFARETDVTQLDLREVAVGPDGSRTYVDEDGKTKNWNLADMDAQSRFEVKIQNRYVEFFDNFADAESARKRAEASGEFEKLSAVQNRRDNAVDLSLMPRQVDILINSIRQRKGLDEAQRKVLEDSIIQAAITLMPGSRVQHRRKPRRYVAGASSDLVQNTLDYSTSVGNYRAKQQLSDDVNDGLKELRKVHGELVYSSPNSIARDDLLTELERRVTSDVTPEHAGGINKWIRLALSLSFLDKLASPAYSLINAMQPFMVTMPVLSAKYGFVQAQSAMLQAYRDIGGISTVTAGLKDTIRMAYQNAGTDFLTSYKDRVREAYPGSKGRELSELFDYMSERGAIDASAGLEIARLNETTSRAGQALNRAELITRALPTAIEAMNRGATAIAAYNLARAKGMTHEAAMKEALTQVNNTQGNYSLTNSPPIFNHPLARISLQFKKYGLMMYHLIGQNVYHAFKGASPEERSQARKALFNLAVVHSAMAGVLGLPLEPIKLLLLPIGLLGGPGYDDLEDELRQALAKYLGNRPAEMILKGLPRGVGFDLSSRVGLDSLLTFGGPRENTEKDVKAWLFDTIGGAPVGLAADWSKGISELLFGDPVKGIEKLVPVKVIADSIRAYREGTEGKVTAAGRQTMQPTNIAEMGLRAFGLAPASVSRKAERDRVFYSTQREGVQERQQMMGTWLNASKAERGRQWDKIRKWNEGKSEGQRITLDDLKRADKRRESEKSKGQIKDGYRVTKRDEDAYRRAEVYK